MAAVIINLSLLDVDGGLVAVLKKADIVFGPLVDAQEWPEGVDVALVEGAVSSHYLVRDDVPPTIYRLVDENRRAYHAGVSSWKGQTALNAASIGIEIA